MNIESRVPEDATVLSFCAIVAEAPDLAVQLRIAPAGSLPYVWLE